jgi:hypothetical protein
MAGQEALLILKLSVASGATALGSARITLVYSFDVVDHGIRRYRARFCKDHARVFILRS